MGLRSKTGFSNGLAHNRSKVSGSWAEIESVHSNYSISIFSFLSNNYESGWLVRFEVWEISPGLEPNKFLGSEFCSGHFENCIRTLNIDKTQCVQMIPNIICDTFQPINMFFMGWMLRFGRN